MTKRSLFQIHKYCGLAAALFLFIQALTGTILVYRGTLAQWIDPAGMVRRSAQGDLSPGRVMTLLEAHDPGYSVQRLVYPDRPSGTYFAYLANPSGGTLYASVDPGNGAILREGSLWRFPAEAALNLHDQLVAGRAGMVMVLLIGLSLLFLAGTGLAQWWPKKGRWRGSLDIRWSLSFRLLLRQLHRSAGVILSAILCVSAVSGLLLAVPMLMDGVAPSPAPVARDAGREAAIDRALAAARAEFPAHAVHDLRLPARDRLKVFLRAPERNVRAVHLVIVDLATGRIARRIAAKDNDALWMITLPFHSGEVIGWIGRLLIFTGGLFLLFLSATGPLMWWHVKRMKKKGKRRPSAPPITQKAKA